MEKTCGLIVSLFKDNKDIKDTKDNLTSILNICKQFPNIIPLNSPQYQGGSLTQRMLGVPDRVGWFSIIPSFHHSTFTPSHLHTFTLSHLHTFTPSHPRQWRGKLLALGTRHTPVKSYFPLTIRLFFPYNIRLLKTRQLK